MSVSVRLEPIQVFQVSDDVPYDQKIRPILELLLVGPHHLTVCPRIRPEERKHTW